MTNGSIRTESSRLTEEQKRWIQRFVNKEDKILLYGPGKMGKLCLAALQAAEYNVVGFMGRNAKKHPEVEGLPCWLPEEIPAEQRGDYLVIISVNPFDTYYSLVRSLNENGFSHVIDGFFLTGCDCGFTAPPPPCEQAIETETLQRCPLRVDDLRRLQPAFPGASRCFVLASNSEFVPALSTMIQSIIETSSPARQYDIVVLYRAIAAENQAKIAWQTEGHENVSIRFYDMGPLVEKGTFYTGWSTRAFPAETYFRLFIPWVLNEEYNFAAFVDADQIARKDLLDIFDIDMGDNIIAAPRDYESICGCHIPDSQRVAYNRSIGIENLENYVIPSMTVFHLPEFRKRYTFEQVWERTTSYHWAFNDMDVLNVLCQHSIHYLSSTWGWMSDAGHNHYLPEQMFDDWRNAAKDPAVVHFASGRKPWVQDYGQFVDCGCWDMEFWRYASHTPYLNDLIGWIKSPEYKTYVTHKLGIA